MSALGRGHWRGTGGDGPADHWVIDVVLIRKIDRVVPQLARVHIALGRIGRETWMRLLLHVALHPFLVNLVRI